MTRKDINNHEAKDPCDKLCDITRHHSSELEAYLRIINHVTTDPELLKDKLIDISCKFQEKLTEAILKWKRRKDEK